MTLTAKALPWNFGGVLMNGDEVVWNCEHQHENPGEAKKCATGELQRRRKLLEPTKDER